VELPFKLGRFPLLLTTFSSCGSSINSGGQFLFFISQHLLAGAFHILDGAYSFLSMGFLTCWTHLSLVGCITWLLGALFKT
jgi:hypothetical protein